MPGTGTGSLFAQSHAPGEKRHWLPSPRLPEKWLCGQESSSRGLIVPQPPRSGCLLATLPTKIARHLRHCGPGP